LFQGLGDVDPDGAHLIRGEISRLEGGGGFGEEAGAAAQDFEAVSASTRERPQWVVSHWVTFTAPDNAHIWEVSNSPMSVAPTASICSRHRTKSRTASSSP
jgi:hypothetical protein